MAPSSGAVCNGMWLGNHKGSRYLREGMELMSVAQILIDFGGSCFVLGKSTGDLWLQASESATSPRAPSATLLPKTPLPATHCLTVDKPPSFLWVSFSST